MRQIRDWTCLKCFTIMMLPFVFIMLCFIGTNLPVGIILIVFFRTFFSTYFKYLGKLKLVAYIWEFGKRKQLNWNVNLLIVI